MQMTLRRLNAKHGMHEQQQKKLVLCAMFSQVSCDTQAQKL